MDLISMPASNPSSRLPENHVRASIRYVLSLPCTWSYWGWLSDVQEDQSLLGTFCEICQRLCGPPSTMNRSNRPSALRASVGMPPKLPMPGGAPSDAHPDQAPSGAV